MREAAANLEFETAARLRDEIKRLKMLDLEFAADAMSTTGEAEARAEAQSARAEYRARYAERPKRGGKR
jgi:excinuclease ABC subunit B